MGLRDLSQDEFLREAVGGNLPTMMIPRVHADFVSGVIDGSEAIPQLAMNNRSGPEGSSEQNVPAIGACGLRAKHFSEERRAEKASKVPPHVVGADGQEERPTNSPSIEDAEKFRYPVTGTSKRVDVNPKPEFHALVVICGAGSESIPIERM